jgi:hypothetical protein
LAIGFLVGELIVRIELALPLAVVLGFAAAEVVFLVTMRLRRRRASRESPSRMPPE